MEHYGVTENVNGQMEMVENVRQKQQMMNFFFLTGPLIEL